MKKLLLILLLFAGCKKESDDTCGTCQYRKITMDSQTGKIVDDEQYGGAFKVCGNENLQNILHYEMDLPDTTGSGQVYKIIGSCQ